MSPVTLIGERIAKPEGTFVFVGPQPECRECKLKAACLQLERGRLYRISGVRDVHHEKECRYHENGVRVVEVKLATIDTSLKAKLAIEGSIVEYKRPVCSNHECENYLLCHPHGLEEAAKVRIAESLKPLSCPLGYNLVGVRVEYS